MRCEFFKKNIMIRFCESQNLDVESGVDSANCMKIALDSAILLLFAESSTLPLNLL